MKKLLNTLYVTSENSYLGLDGENVVVYDDKNEIGRLPLHNLEEIISFGYRGTSPALMGACADRNISLCYLTPQGKFLARVSGKVKGNVVLRKQQFQSSSEDIKCLEIAKNCILGKVYNSRWVLERAIRDHSMQIDVDKVKKASIKLKEFLDYIQNSQSMNQLRGYEGEAASIYFGVFDELILQQKKDFFFQGRNRRPPLDNVNAMLSFTYTLLTTQITSALEVVGLDPYVGYMHTERPGRVSLSLDLIEELRAVMADRFVLSLINKKIVNGKNFIKKENGAVLMDTDIRKKLLSEWQNKKKEIITHPYLNEKVEWGMVPFVQAMLLARYLRGDLDEYPVFLWKCGDGVLVLITYDVNTETAEGKTRLRKVAKQCVNYGRRVQNSVFECILDNAQCVMLKAILTDLIDKDVDSLRFYYLGNRYQTKIEHVGVDRADQTLIL